MTLDLYELAQQPAVKQLNWFNLPQISKKLQQNGISMDAEIS